MEYIGYTLLALVAVCWLGAILFSMVAIFPFGLIGFAALGGIGFLFAKVVKDRLENREDDFYSRNVEK